MLFQANNKIYLADYVELTNEDNDKLALTILSKKYSIDNILGQEYTPKSYYKVSVEKAKMVAEVRDDAEAQQTSTPQE